jgi:hypothetical protein
MQSVRPVSFFLFLISKSTRAPRIRFFPWGPRVETAIGVSKNVNPLRQSRLRPHSISWVGLVILCVWWIVAAPHADGCYRMNPSRPSQDLNPCIPCPENMGSAWIVELCIFDQGTVYSVSLGIVSLIRDFISICEWKDLQVDINFACMPEATAIPRAADSWFWPGVRGPCLEAFY